jgi:hypothetical protein
MKKLILLTAISFIWITAVLPLNVSAADITVGATTWYSWWDFDNPDNNDNPDIDPTLLYGPAFSVKFSDDFNLTFVYLYGKFDMNESEGTNEIARNDSDLALNYRLNDYFKIFAGVKYMGYTFTGFEHIGYGPGAGISFVLPLGNDFFVLGNISGLYLWGSEDNESNDISLDYNEYGANTGISLAYYIAPASTTISLGGRYQYFKTDYEKADSGSESDAGTPTHKFYGITLAATYTFSI